MKAATPNARTSVLHGRNPTATTTDELVMTVRTAIIKNTDRGRGRSNRYAATPDASIGSDGGGLLAGSQRACAVNPDGMVAQQAVVEAEHLIP